jgi:hypothetical protein
VQLVLLVFTAVLAVGVVPLALLTTNRYLGAAVFSSPAKTPAASAQQVCPPRSRPAAALPASAAAAPPHRVLP